MEKSVWMRDLMSDSDHEDLLSKREIAAVIFYYDGAEIRIRRGRRALRKTQHIDLAGQSSQSMRPEPVGVQPSAEYEVDANSV